MGGKGWKMVKVRKTGENLVLLGIHRESSRILTRLWKTELWLKTENSISYFPVSKSSRCVCSSHRSRHQPRLAAIGPSTTSKIHDLRTRGTHFRVVSRSTQRPVVFGCADQFYDMVILDRDIVYMYVYVYIYIYVCMAIHGRFWKYVDLWVRHGCSGCCRGF